jgi:hypothetical protein
MLHSSLRYVTFSALTLNLRLCNVTFTSLLRYILVEVTFISLPHYIHVSTVLPLHLGYITFISVTLHFRLPLIMFTSLARYILVSDTSLLHFRLSYINVFVMLHLRLYNNTLLFPRYYINYYLCLLPYITISAMLHFRF